MIIHDYDWTIACVRVIDRECQVFVLSIIYTDSIISDPRTAIYRIYIYNYAEPLSVLTIAWNIFICSSAIFLTRDA